MAEVTSGDLTVLVLDYIETKALCLALGSYNVHSAESVDEYTAVANKLSELCDALGVHMD